MTSIIVEIRAAEGGDDAKLLVVEQTRIGEARDATRWAQVGSGMRGDKRRTVRTQDDQVVDAVSGQSWRFKDYERGIW